MNRLLSSIACCILIALSIASRAEETAPPAEQPQQPADLGVIEVEAESIKAATRALSTDDITVITPKEWHGARTVEEAIERISSANITRTGGEGSIATVSLRAAGATNTLVMINGVPVTLPGGTPIDLSLISLADVKRIEVLPGGLSIHGSRAIGGVVNIITQEAEKAGRRMELSVGSFGTMKGSYSAGGSGNKGSNFWQISAFTTDGDFHFLTVNGLERVRRNNDARRLNFLWQHQSYSAEELRTAFVSAAVMKRGVPGFAEFPTPSAELTEQTLTSGWDMYKPESGKNWAQEYSIGLSQGYLRFKDDAPAMGGPVKSRSADASLLMTSTFARERKDGRFEVSIAASGNAMEADDYGDPSRATARVSIIREWRLDRLTLTPSAGIDVCSDMPSEGTWELRSEWKLAPGVALSASAGRSFRYPEFAELYFPAQGFIAGNPNLHPEHADSLTAGLKVERSEFSLRLSAFDRRQHDFIRFLPVSAALLKPMNTGSSRAKGLEAGCTLELSPRLSADIAYAYTSASYSHSGIDFTQTPRNRFSSTLHYSSGEWDCSTTLIRESSQGADLFGSIRVPAQQRLDLAVSHRLGKGRLEVAATNLLDENNRDYWDLPLPGRCFEVKWYRSL